MNVFVRTDNLCKKYGHTYALRDASIEIHQGDIYGIVGRNGAGKSTLMKLITGLTGRTAGELELFGQTEDLFKQRRRIGAIVETPEFFPYFSGEQNLEYFRRQRGIVDPGVVERALRQVGLADAGRKKFKAYSLGMKQRLGLALALMGEPDVLVLDEPVNGIDPAGIVEMRHLLLRLNQEKHITILISSHILAELSNLATRFAIIDQGVILEELSAEELALKSRAYIELRTEQPRRAVAILERDLGFTQFLVDAHGQIRLFEGFDQLGAISQKLVQENVGLLGMEQRHDSLEDYFLNLIGGGRHAQLS